MKIRIMFRQGHTTKYFSEHYCVFLLEFKQLFLTADIAMLDKSNWLLWSQSKTRSP